MADCGLEWRERETVAWSGETTGVYQATTWVTSVGRQSELGRTQSSCWWLQNARSQTFILQSCHQQQQQQLGYWAGHAHWQAPVNNYSQHLRVPMLCYSVQSRSWLILTTNRQPCRTQPVMQSGWQLKHSAPVYDSHRDRAVLTL